MAGKQVKIWLPQDNHICAGDQARELRYQATFKTARELKKRVPGWGNKQVCFIQKTLQKRLKLPSHPYCPKAPSYLCDEEDVCSF
jgi:hypothetical protein